MAVATMTSKGRVTIPKGVRESLKLEAGARLDLVVRSNGEVVLKPVRIDTRELGGILHRKERRTVSLEAMDVGVARLLNRRR